MSNDSFDLLVIGGGITGAGIALDASARGLKVALVDMQDFAAGTSSRSTKLIHGGLRYLKQLEFKLVAEVGKEREIVHQNAPHLTKPEPMLLPIVKGGSLGTFSARLGMWVYEWLAGVKKEEWHKVLTREETIAAEPLLKTENLLGGILFYEYRTDDARLTIEVMKEAVNRGALALNYAKVISFNFENGKISGAKIQNQITKEEFEIKARYVVNAGGPWVDALDDLDNVDKKQNAHKLQITKGVHIVVDGKRFPIKQSLYFDTHDNRMTFVIPREGKTYIGTTDTFYAEDLVHPKTTKADSDYLLKCVNNYFPDCKLTESDIESNWAGLRPLVSKPRKGPSEISRKDELFLSTTGLITIAGGKLTGYRKMAQRVVDLIAKSELQNNKNVVPSCSTETIQLSGGKVNGAKNYQQFVQTRIKEGVAIGLSEKEATTLAYRYGSNADKLFAIAQQQLNVNSDLPLILRAQIIYATEEEMCMSPVDFFVRRTGAMYFDFATVKTYKAQVSQYMQGLLGWSEELKISLDKELNLLIENTSIKYKRL